MQSIFGRQLGDVDERRGHRSGRVAVVGGAIVLAILVLIAILGAPRQLARDLFSSRRATQGPALERTGDSAAAVVESLRAMHADVDQVWSRVLGGYQSPALVLYDHGYVDGSCGFSSSATGTFYCPEERKLYVDTAFFVDLHQRAGVAGELAQAYVFAHAVGHHLQTLTGLAQRVEQRRAELGEIEGNQLGLREELQADCFAGIYAHHSPELKDRRTPGDIEVGLAAAALAGQASQAKRTHGFVVPEELTHATGMQRSQWFRRGLSSGDPSACNAFEAAVL